MVMNKGDSAFILRLKDRLEQDPGSKLFLSLAEELRKRDRVEEAVALLVDGISRRPDFPAAQLTLGRWYLSGLKFAEAAEQFSEVLKKTPGNNFARKGLAEANKELVIFSEVPEAATVSPEPPLSHRPEPDLSKLVEAEGLIARGHYAPAMELYRGMLTNSPGDRRILQRQEELAALIKFLGKNKEGIIKRLNKFLEAIKIHFAPQSVGYR
jgi:tetratricopeptide (TPR) repeat protein